MHAVTLTAFRDELEKLAYHSVVDIAGLGILAAPTVQKMRGKEMSEKGTHAAELGGLGVLAGSSAHKIYSGMRDAAKGAAKGGKFRAALSAVKHASVKKAALDMWNPSTGALHAAEGGSRAANAGTHVGQQAVQALKKPAFTMDHLKAGRAALAAKGITPKGFVGKSVGALGALGKHASAGPLVLGALSIFKTA